MLRRILRFFLFFFRFILAPTLRFALAATLLAFTFLTGTFLAWTSTFIINIHFTIFVIFWNVFYLTFPSRHFLPFAYLHLKKYNTLSICVWSIRTYKIEEKMVEVSPFFHHQPSYQHPSFPLCVVFFSFHLPFHRFPQNHFHFPHYHFHLPPHHHYFHYHCLLSWWDLRHGLSEFSSRNWELAIWNQTIISGKLGKRQTLFWLCSQKFKLQKERSMLDSSAIQYCNNGYLRWILLRWLGFLLLWKKLSCQIWLRVNWYKKVRVSCVPYYPRISLSHQVSSQSSSQV